MELSHIARHDGRLSDILKNEMQISTGLMNRLKWDERILVNGVPRRTNYYVAAGDRVSLMLDEPEPQYPGEDLPLRVLYEDAYFLAVDKDPGILIHPSRSRDSGTLANAVVGYYQRSGQKCAFHPITRLDRDTFGVVLIAKNSHTHALMQQTPLQKTYHGLVYGVPQTEKALIDAPIDRYPLPSLLRYVNQNGKPSQTRFKVLTQYEGHSLLELEPITGRTHQLRVHCAHIGCPILGDPQYGTPESGAYSERFGFTYQRLCAKKVAFLHPITGEKLVIESKMNA